MSSDSKKRLHPLDSPSNQKYYTSNGKRGHTQSQQEPTQTESILYNNNSRRRAPDTFLPHARSASRFDLDQNRAHNPHENPFSTAVYSRYDSSPKRKNIVKKRRRGFLEKIVDGQYQGVLTNKNESKGFDRYVGDCKDHLETALELQKM